MPPYANNNQPPGAPRDPTFGNVGRPNGRSPGNGAPSVTAAGAPPATKSSVTISNGRDPRRAKRWNWGLEGAGEGGMWEIYGRHHLPPLLQLSDLSAPSSSQPVLAIKNKKNQTTDYLQNFFLF